VLPTDRWRQGHHVGAVVPGPGGPQRGRAREAVLGALDLTFVLVFVAHGPNLIVIYAGGTKPLPREDLEALTRTALTKLG
jgi:hypothetical protein